MLDVLDLEMNLSAKYQLSFHFHNAFYCFQIIREEVPLSIELPVVVFVENEADDILEPFAKKIKYVLPTCFVIYIFEVESQKRISGVI